MSTTSLSADRIDALLREADRAALPSNNGRKGKYYGTFMEPRASTDASIDEAARSVADAILREPGNQKQFLNVRQCYSMPVPDMRGSGAVVYEWNANRIINDRVWDWMLWMSKNGPAVRELNPPLPEGYFRAYLYHQCGPSCNAMRQNLLRTNVAGAALTACTLSGIVHLCRADSKSCTVLEEGDDTQLTCQESGMVCQDVGVHMSGAGDMRFMKAQRGIELGMGARSDGGNRSNADPESVRRADAIEAIRATCPQIVGWDRETGELTVNMSILPDQARGETFFDPSFYWVRTKWRGAAGAAIVSQPLGSEPREAESYVSALGKMTQAMQSEKKRWQRSTRAKRVRSATRHRQRRCALPGASRERSELLTEKDTIERVLDHVLWDAETRERVNAARTEQVSDAVARNLQHHIQPRSVSDLLTSMARGGGATVPPPPPVPMTADAIHKVCMSTLRAHLIPVICFDEALHNQLVKIVLYLWNVVVHVPEEEQGSYRPKKRRYRETPAASLTRFTLAVLYTAASSGIYIGNRAAWPKDWWLADHLPAEATLGLYYGAKQKLCDHRRLRRKQGARDPLDYVSPVPASDADPTPLRRDYQTMALYDTKDVACGNRELVAALSMYDGDNPTAEEVAAYLRQAYADAYRGPPEESDNHHHHHNNTAEVEDTAKGRSGVSITTTTMMAQARSKAPVRFCCMFVPHRGAGADPKRRVHVCVMFDPYDAAGPPMLQKYSDNVAANWRLDTIIGPFVHDVDAREFCVEWARDRCGAEERRGFGIRLAQRLGLHIWVEEQEEQEEQDDETAPFSGMEDVPVPMSGDADVFGTAIAQRRGPAPPYIAREPPASQRDVFNLWSAFSMGDAAGAGGKRLADSVVYDQDDVEMATDEAPVVRGPIEGPPDVAYHLFRHWQL